MHSFSADNWPVWVISHIVAAKNTSDRERSTHIAFLSLTNSALHTASLWFHFPHVFVFFHKDGSERHPFSIPVEHSDHITRNLNRPMHTTTTDPSPTGSGDRENGCRPAGGNPGEKSTLFSLTSSTTTAGATPTLTPKQPTSTSDPDTISVFDRYDAGTEELEFGANEHRTAGIDGYGIGENNVGKQDPYNKDDNLTAASMKVKKNRRKHFNSKNGCGECKNRKNKCDERMPICSFCKKRGIQCSYLLMTPYQIHRIEETHSTNYMQKYQDTNDVLYNNSDIVQSQPEPNYNFTGSGFGDHPSREINLDNTSVYDDNFVYQAHEMEGILLPASMSHFLLSNQNTQETNYDDFNNLFEQSEHPNQPTSQLMDPIPLQNNTKISRRVFDISNEKIIDYFDKFCNYFFELISLLLARDFASMGRLLKGKKMDATLSQNFFQVLNTYQIFDKLLRKSLFLLSMDYYKNTLLKLNILPYLNYEVKLSITGSLEIYSSVFIHEITNIIKQDYLPYVHQFSHAKVNSFYGCFLALNDAMGYHFKHGLKYEMSMEEGEKCINLVPIFITGYFSIIMEKSRAEIMMSSGTNILSAHLMSQFKRLLIPNYDIKIFDDFRSIVEKINVLLGSDVNCENLKLFCEKHSKLIALNQHRGTLFGFNNGYLIRLLNSYQSIVPFDLCNFSFENTEFYKDKEGAVIIALCYQTLAYILDAIIPCMCVAVPNRFVGYSWGMVELTNMKNSIKMLQLVESKQLRLFGVYLIRTSAFFKNHRGFYANYLSTYTLGTMLNEDTSQSINERYLRLLTFKQEGIMDEIQLCNLLLDRGQFIKRWNYPNTTNLKPKRDEKAAENKIMKYFDQDTDALMDDFFATNTGFFSRDYDCTTNLSADTDIVLGASFVDGSEIKMVWKLSTYIRMNNL